VTLGGFKPRAVLPRFVTTSRHDRLTSRETGPGNSLSHWRAVKSPWIVARNYAAIVIARHSPSLRLKNWLYRRLGMDVAPGARFALEATPDVFFPELITVERDAIVGYDATVLTHEFLQEECRTGPVRIGEGAMVGAGAIVLPGVEIGAGARIAANSLVSGDVPPDTTVAGVPAEPID
jgi:acetyltransferase-like isoleucine patch superfamily enzyme